MIMRVMMMTMMTNNLSCHPAVSQIWAPVRQLPKGRTYHQTIKNFLITQNSRLNNFRISLAKKTPPWKFQGTGQLRVDLKTPKKRTLEHQREPQTLCFHWSNYEIIKTIPHLNKQAKQEIQKKTVIVINQYLRHNTRIAEGSLFLFNVKFAICFRISVWMDGLAFAWSNRGIYIPVREV